MYDTRDGYHHMRADVSIRVHQKANIDLGNGECNPNDVDGVLTLEANVRKKGSLVNRRVCTHH